MSMVFACKRGRGLRRSIYAHYDHTDLRVLFHWTGSISSDKSRSI